MNDFKAARTNMVDCQIHPSGVISAAILNAFGIIPREKFAPANMQTIAYADKDLAVGSGRFLLEPAVHARMIQAAEAGPDDTVLDVGGGQGYPAAILSSIVRRVTALEIQDFLDPAQKLWRELGIHNIAGVAGDLAQGAPRHGPFDLIFINGAVGEIPQTLAGQLSANGRLVAILKPAESTIGQAVVVRRSGNSGFSSYPLFDAGSPYLAGFEPKKGFSF